MVRSGHVRKVKYVANNDPMAIFLQTKKQKRVPKKPLAVQALKDAAGKVIIDAYDLDIRLKSLAWQAWRELYFMGYFKQVVTEIV